MEMSETELVKRMADTLYGPDGLVTSVSEIKGGVRAIAWMVGTILVVFMAVIAYLGYVNANKTHAVLLSNDPVVTASSDAGIPRNP
jgi:hypothetical protein